MTQNINLVLVGYEPQGSENLSLRLLAQAVTESGFNAAVVPCDSLTLAPQAVALAVRRQPAVLGFSLQDTQNSLHALALCQFARKLGFKGLILCGGPFATLQTQWILDRAPAVDGIIRFDGEAPLVALMAALTQGSSLRAVPSFATREFTTPPAPWPASPHWRPMRGPRPQLMGIPSAALIAGRGCREHCDYCTHAAQASLQVKERALCGISPAELRRSGLGQTKERPLPDLADEMAELYHSDRVRYFHFVDENPIPKNEAVALGWIGSLKQLLAERQIKSCALSLMTRGDALTPKVVQALIDLGLIRSLVGVESGSTAGLTGIGRTGDAKKGYRGLDLLARAGVITTFNSLIVHPQSTPASIRQELFFLSGVRNALWDTAQIRPFPGTRLHEKMSRQNRVRGGQLLPTFEIFDEAVDRFRTLLIRFSTQVLGASPPSFFANDLLLSAVLAERFGDNPTAATAVKQTLWQVLNRLNRERIQTLFLLLEASQGRADAETVIEEAKSRFAVLRDELVQAEKRLKNAGSKKSEPARCYRNLTAAASFVFALASAGIPAGCDQQVDDATNDFETETNDDEDSDTEDSTDSDTQIDTDSETDCSDNITQDEVRLIDLVQTNCDAQNHEPQLEIKLDRHGQVTSVQVLEVDTDQPWVETLVQCYEDLLKDEIFPCLAGETIWIDPLLVGIPLE